MKSTGVSLIAVLVLAITVSSSAPAVFEPRARTLSGEIGLYAEGRRGHNSSSIRQDWDLTTDIDLAYGEATRRLWSFDLSARLTTDLDGRRPSNEPGIYNGIRETFSDNVQPWLYRAGAARKFDWSLGPVSDPLMKLGRQYRGDGDFLWFDGADARATIAGPSSFVGDFEVSGFGGVPVRLYGSATSDWLAGLGLSWRMSRARFAAEAYHISDHRQNGAVIRDNVARISMRTPIGDALHFHATSRVTESEGVEMRSNLLWNTGFLGITVKGDARFQGDDRGSLSTELDAASAVHGRAIGAPRRAFQEFGLAASLPIRDLATIDIGGSTRETRTSQDRYNLDFDRVYASLSVPSLSIPRRGSASITFDAYESAGDWTRSVSGELSSELTDRLKISIGSAYALYSYDYTTLEVKDDVRSITGRLDWRVRDDLRFEARYDGEYDDRRLHHYLKLGGRYEL